MPQSIWGPMIGMSNSRREDHLILKGDFLIFNKMVRLMGSILISTLKPREWKCEKTAMFHCLQVGLIFHLFLVAVFLAKIHQALKVRFSLLTAFLIKIVPVKD